jgi:phage-related protein
MANTDGSLKFDTELDNSGFEKGSAKLEQAVNNLKGSINSTGADMMKSFSGVVPILQDIATNTAQIYGAMADNGNRAAQANQAVTASAAAAGQAVQQQAQSVRQQGQAVQQAAQAAQSASAAMSNGGAAKTLDAQLTATERSAGRLDTQMRGLADSLARGLNTDSQFTNFDIKMGKAEEAAQNLKQQLIDLGKQRFNTAEYDQLTASIQKTENSLFGLYNRRDVMEQLGVKENSKEWQRLAIQIENTEAILERYETQKAKMEADGSAFVSGTDSAEWLRQAQAIRDTIAQLQAYKAEAVQMSFDSQLNATDAAAQKLDKQINALSQSLQNGLKTPAQMNSFASKFDAAQSAAANLQARLASLAEGLQDVEGVDGNATQAISGFNAQAEAVQSLLDRLEECRSAAADLGIVIDPASTAAETVQNLGNETQNAGAGASFASRFFGAFTGELRNAASAAGNAAKNIAKMAWQSVASGVKNAEKNLGLFNSQAKSTGNSVSGLIKQLTSLKTVLISRIKRMFISQIFSGVGDAINALAKFNTAFDKSMSNIKNSATGLSANISVGLGNLISLVEPVLTRIINAISTAITYLNALFALLGGKSTITVAKKQTGSYAASLDKASKSAKDLNEQVYGFDELNKRQKKTDSSGGGGSGTGDLFETKNIDDILPKAVKDYLDRLKAAIEAGDWYGVGKIIAEGLNTAFKAVDDWINGTLRPQGVKWAKNIAQIFNGIVDNLDWTLVGKTVADGLNAIADIVNTFFSGVNWVNLGFNLGVGLHSMFDTMANEGKMWGEAAANVIFNWWVDTLYGLVSNPTWWQDMGRFLGTALDSMVKSIHWENMFSIISLGINDIALAVIQFCKSIDWYGCAKAIADGFEAALHKIDWKTIGKALSDLFLGLVEAALGFVAEIDWVSVGQSIGKGLMDMIGAIDWASVVAACAALIVSIFGGLIELVLGALGGAAEGLAEGFASIGMDGVAGLFKGISDALLGIGTWLKTQLVDPIVNDIKEFLGIHSPSTVFAEIGMNLILGLLQGISETWGQIPAFFSTVLTALESTIGTAWTSIKETVSTAASNAYQAVSTAWTAVKTETSTAWTAAKQTVSDAWQKVKADTSTTVANVRSSVGQAWSNVKATTSTTFANVQTTATRKFNAMRASVVSTANNIRTSIASTWQSVQTTASSKWQSITSTVTSKWNALKSSLMAKSSEWTSIGTNLVQGLKSGIENAWHALTSKVQSLAQNLTNTMKNAVGVHSPSVIWAKIAYYLDQGLLKGLRAGEPSVLSGVDSLADKMTAGLDFSNISFSLPSMSAISDMIASAGQLAIPDIAAGTVIPYKTKIDTSGAEIDASATLSDNFSGIDERLSDLQQALTTIITILRALNINIDMDALTKMITRKQKSNLIVFGGA